jgi:Zn finger protein HypA/HybF involved in hydrogenase expression
LGDGLVGFLVTLPIYVGICLAVAAVFMFADRRVRNVVRRPPVKCETCEAEIETSVLARLNGKCPSCGHRQTNWREALEAEMDAKATKAAAKARKTDS